MAAPFKWRPRRPSCAISNGERLAGGKALGGGTLMPREGGASMRRWKLSKGCAVIILAALVLVGCAATSSRESTGEYF
jgi:hypothetical protein